MFLDHCRTLIRYAEEAEAAVRQAATGRDGRLGVGAVATALSWPLRLVREEFHRAVPDVEIRTHEAAAGLLDRSPDRAIVRRTAPVRGTTATSRLADRPAGSGGPGGQYLGLAPLPYLRAAAAAAHPGVRFRALRNATATIGLSAMTRTRPGEPTERLTTIDQRPLTRGVVPAGGQGSPALLAPPASARGESATG